MNATFPQRLAATLLCGWLTLASTTAQASAADRSAEAILKEINNIQPATPTAKDGETAASRAAFLAKMNDYRVKRVDLIGELYKSHPENPELATLMPQRWQAGSLMPARAVEIRTEMKEAVATSKNEKLVADASWFLVMDSGRQGPGSLLNVETITPVLEDFIKRYPKDQRAAGILAMMANQTKDTARQEALNKRIETDYPDSPAFKTIAAKRKKLEGVGKPFDLEFTDAIHGSPVSIKGLKGKVVVIDFWATWCGPCIAEMPKMKKLYAEYKDKGVEFIGISLDQPKEKGGLDKLKDYVAKNGIQWPQYYQGNFWQSEFSSSWGVNSIPCVFLVDAEGNLASIEARGQLEKMIPEYLEKAKSGKTKTASTR